jgi:hypothetical protein
VVITCGEFADSEVALLRPPGVFRDEDEDMADVGFRRGLW